MKNSFNQVADPGIVRIAHTSPYLEMVATVGLSPSVRSTVRLSPEHRAEAVLVGATKAPPPLGNGLPSPIPKVSILVGGSFTMTA